MSRLRFYGGLMGLALWLAACAPAALPSTETAVPLSPTPTLGPILMCTAPACPNGALVCNQADGCLGGCGTVCERFTPTPAQTPQPVCTAPVCTNGTLTCGDPNGCPGGCGTICAVPTLATPPEVSPTLSLMASATTLQVGQTITVVGQLKDVGLPYYRIYLQDQGQATANLLVEITYDNAVRQQADPSAVLTLGTVNGEMAQVTLVLVGRAVGETDLTISATGEVMAAGGAMWSGASSEPLHLTIVP